MEIDDIMKRKLEIIKQIQILEWDTNRKQIHLGQQRRLESMKIELVELEDKLSSNNVEDKLNEVK